MERTHRLPARDFDCVRDALCALCAFVRSPRGNPACTVCASSSLCAFSSSRTPSGMYPHANWIDNVCTLTQLVAYPLHQLRPSCVPKTIFHTPYVCLAAFAIFYSSRSSLGCTPRAHSTRYPYFPANRIGNAKTGKGLVAHLLRQLHPLFISTTMSRAPFAHVAPSALLHPSGRDPAGTFCAYSLRYHYFHANRIDCTPLLSLASSTRFDNHLSHALRVFITPCVFLSPQKQSGVHPVCVFHEVPQLSRKLDR